MKIAATLLLAAVLVQQTPQPSEVRVDPSELELAVEEARTLDVQALDGAGNPIEGLRTRWYVVEGDAVTVTQEGEVRAVQPGRARLAAVVGRAAGFVTVSVPQLPPSEIEARVAGGGVLQGTSAPLEITARTRLGDVLDAPALRFESSDGAVASVDATGRVFARSPGEATIRIRAEEGEAATTAVPVQVVASDGLDFELTPAAPRVRTGDVVRFQVAASGAGNGAPEALRPAWTVSGSGASIEEEGTDGVFVAAEPGRYRVTARIGEREVRTSVVDVEPREYESRLVKVGRGPISSHHSGDTWAFEGVDGRDYAYVGTFMHDWMTAWDITDPGNPVLTDSLRLDARRINDVKIHPNNRLAVVTREGASDRRNGIVLLDLSEPAHPRILSEYKETVTGGVHNVWIEGEHDLVYACHNGTSDLHIIDISDPEAPQEVGRWGLDRATKTLHDVIVQDGYAYLSYWDDGLVILDVGAGTHGGTPTEPTFVSRISYPEGNTHVAWRHGDYVFVGDEIFPDDWDADRPIEARGFIHVIDVSDIDAPREVAKYEVPEAGAHNVWVEGDRLYVGYYQGGLRVVDISGELRGDLYRQGRELARLLPIDGQMAVPNWPMTWGAQIFKGKIISSDLNSGLWITELRDDESSVVF